MTKKLEVEVRASPTQRAFSLACLSSLPSSLKNPRVAAMLAEAMVDVETARGLESDPRAMFARCGIEVPKGIQITVHRSTPTQVHIALPAWAESGKKPGKVKITDDDLLSTGLTEGAQKQIIAKGAKDDAFGGDHGDLGPGHNFYNSGNTYDRVRSDDP